MFLLVPAYPGCPGSKAVKRSLLLLLFGQQVNQVYRISHVHHSHPELIMEGRVKCLLEVHKAHIEWLLVLACLVHQYSEIRDLITCPFALSESCLFICNFRFGLYSDPLQYDPKKGHSIK